MKFFFHNLKFLFRKKSVLVETLKRLKKGKKLFQGSLQITEKVTQKFYNSCSERFKVIPWKTLVVVYFNLILPNKSTPPWMTASEIIWESRRDGFHLCRCSRSKMLEQLFRKVCGGILFLILANKELHDGQFPGNFLKYFKAVLRKNPGRLLLQGFSLYGSSHLEVLKKLL